MNENATWNLNILDPVDNIVYTDSGSEGIIQCTWDGKVNGSYIDNLYQAILSVNGLEISRCFLTVSKRVATVLITGVLDGEPDWARPDLIKELTAVADACRARGLYFTMVRDPAWRPDSERPSLQNLLLNGYKYWFYTGHGSFVKCEDGNRRVQISLYDQSPYGDDYWLSPNNRINTPAFSDLNPNLINHGYRIIMLNLCNSAGSAYLGQIDVSIANAFGIYGALEIDQTYLGWTSGYNLGWPRYGSIWTKDFWYHLGLGYTVTQAQGWANYLAPGPLPMHWNLLIYGGPNVTYFTW